MRYCSVLAEVEVISIEVEVHVSFLHCCNELIVVSLTLTSSDYLTYSRNKEVNCGNSLAVCILLHVEGLYLLWIVCNEYSLLENLLREVSLVLCLEVAAPFYRVNEVLARLFKELDSFCVGNSAELVRDKLFKTCFESLFKVCIKECYLVGTLFKELADNVLHHALCYLDNIIELCKSNLGFDVPEFSKVLRSVGVLGTE